MAARYCRFLKRADGNLRNHELRQTAIIHIPVDAGDGYYRLALCSSEKKKVLCSSPVFRVLSTSMSPGSIKGASLSTLPLEIGAKILASTAKSSIGNAISPVTSAIKQQVQPYKPSWSTRTAVSTAYDVSGIENIVDSNIADANYLYDQKRGVDFTPLLDDENSPEDGPRPPFPISFMGNMESMISNKFDMPMASLTAVPEEILGRLSGYYFGWVRGGKRQNIQKTESMASDNLWYQAIVVAILPNPAQLPSVNLKQLGKKNISIYLVQDKDQETIPMNTRLEVRVMGFIRPPPDQTARLGSTGETEAEDGTDAEEAMLNAIADVEITQSFLDQPAWAPESPLALERSESGKLGALEKAKASYADARVAAQRQIDRLPLHMAGVRLPVDRMREAGIGRGGWYVVR